jgi:hypothetical protein
MAKQTKGDIMLKWVAFGFSKRKEWDFNKKKPLRTETLCDYLYDNYWDIMRTEGLTRNDIFYGMRFPMNRLKKEFYKIK